jgi:hypothetical protein
LRAIYIGATIAVLLLSLSLASAYASDYSPDPTIRPGVGLQPPVTITGCELAQPLCLLYPDGANVTLAQPATMEVRACSLEPNGKCVTLQVPLVNGTTPCNYAYTVNATTLGLPIGNIRLYIVGGSMVDIFGHRFPSVDTLIGTITLTAECTPPSTPSQGICGNVTDTTKPLPEGCNVTSTVANKPPSLSRDVQPPVESTNPAPAAQQTQSKTTVKSQQDMILGILGTLVVVGALVTFRPRKH